MQSGRGWKVTQITSQYGAMSNVWSDGLPVHSLQGHQKSSISQQEYISTGLVDFPPLTVTFCQLLVEFNGYRTLIVLILAIPEMEGQIVRPKLLNALLVLNVSMDDAMVPGLNIQETFAMGPPSIDEHLMWQI
jgi:hypothetical protein